MGKSVDEVSYTIVCFLWWNSHQCIYDNCIYGLHIFTIYNVLGSSNNVPRDLSEFQLSCFL